MRSIHKVVATIRYSPEQMAQVRSFFPEAAFVQVDRSDTDTLLKELKDADVALVSGDLDDRFLGDNQLKWIHCDHAGLAQSAKPELFDRGILLSGAAGRSSPVLAEHAIYFMLAACYHTRELLHAQDSHQWGVADQSAWHGLYGRTAGLVGMGNNGKMLANRLRALGMRFYAFNPLAGGMLTGKHHHFKDVPEPGRFARLESYRKRYWKQSYFDAVDEIRKACEAEGIAMAEAAYRWLAFHSCMDASKGDGILLGASRMEQMMQNMAAAEKGELPLSILDTMDAAWEMARPDSPAYFKFI